MSKSKTDKKGFEEKLRTIKMPVEARKNVMKYLDDTIMKNHGEKFSGFEDRMIYLCCRTYMAAIITYIFDYYAASNEENEASMYVLYGLLKNGYIDKIDPRTLSAMDVMFETVKEIRPDSECCSLYSGAVADREMINAIVEYCLVMLIDYAFSFGAEGDEN